MAADRTDREMTCVRSTLANRIGAKKTSFNSPMVPAQDYSAVHVLQIIKGLLKSCKQL